MQQQRTEARRPSQRQQPQEQHQQPRQEDWQAQEAAAWAWRQRPRRRIRPGRCLPSSRLALAAAALALALAVVLPLPTALAAPLDWQPAVPRGVYLPQQFGVQKLTLGGPLLLTNGSTVFPEVVVYLKALPQPGGGLALRAAAFFYDTVEQTPVKAWNIFPLHMLACADYIKDAAAPIRFELRPVRPGDAHAPTSEGAIELPHVRPAGVSLMQQRLNDTSTVAEHWLFQKGGDEYTAVLPFTLIANISAAHLAGVDAFTFCINDWYKCALLPVPLLKDEVFAQARPQGQAGAAAGTAAAEAQAAHHHRQLGPGARRSQLSEQQQHQQHQHSAGADGGGYAAVDAAYRGESTFVVFTKPVFGVSAAAAARLIYYRTMFHVSLGFSYTLLYERGGYLNQLLQTPRISKLIDDGQLAIMMWTNDQSGVPMIPIDPGQWGNYDQWTMDTHAALALWGRNAWVLMADWDEYLHVPEGVRVQDLFAAGGCLHGVTYASLNRYNYHCDDGAGIEYGAADSGGHPDDGGADLVPYFSRCTGREPEWKEWPKVLVAADAVAYYQVHDGFLYREFAAGANPNVSEACASLVHLHSLVRARVHDTRREHDGSWLHPFAAAAAEGGASGGGVGASGARQHGLRRTQ